MTRRGIVGAWGALLAGRAMAQGVVTIPPTSPNGKKRPKNGECPSCATQHVAISKPVTGCKQWVPGPNGGAVCPPDKVKLGKPTVPDNALPFGEVFAVRCLHCSGVFIQDPE